MNTSKIFIALAVIACMLTTAAFAKTPNDLKDLVGDRASSAERQLENRGYYHRNTQYSGSRTYANWWNPDKQKCVTVATKDGRYDAITKTEKFDCDDNRSGSHNNHSNNNSYHNYNNYNNYSYNNSSEYDRGYRDGLNNDGYHNNRDNVEYSTGYRQGVLEYHGMEDNNHRNDHHHSSSSQHYSNHNDYQSTARGNFGSLVGQSQRSADSGLRNQGYRQVDTLTSGYTFYSIWFNRSSRQCLQMAVANGRADSIVDIKTHPACH